MFTQQDLQQIAGHGLTLGQVETQLENFRRGFPFLNVVRAASPGDGVTVVDRGGRPTRPRPVTSAMPPGVWTS